MNVPRRVRRRLIPLFIGSCILLTLFYTILPPDSPVRLALNFNSKRLANTVRGAATDRDAWLRKPARFPVDLRNDVGYLIKTGYGTRHRVPEQLRALGKTGDFIGEEGQNFLVVADYTTVNETDAKRIGVPVHDAIKKIMDHKIEKRMEDYPRFVKYKSLQEQIDAGNEEKANYLGKTFGWELDALKFIMGMEMIYNDLPEKKKWYIILDDDTFLIKSSLQLLLSRLDPKKPQYIGNAVGDYKGRFAHGGSAIIISGEAMKRLFKSPKIVAEAYAESMDETWGDRLVATTFQKLGIYIVEAFNHHFNGEPPSITRIWHDRFCSPLISFHGLRLPGEMLNVGRTLAEVEGPILWSDVWELFGGTPLAHLAQKPMEQKADHVGKLEEHGRVWGEVKSAKDCEAKCDEHGKWCLAWTYEVEGQRCSVSPWMILGGEPATEGRSSGVNWRKTEALLRECQGFSL